MSNQTNELQNTMASFFQMNTASSLSSGSLPGKTIANPKGKLKAITTESGFVLDGPFVPMPPPFINPEEDERAEETLTNPELAEYTIKVPHPLVQKAKPTSLKNYVVHKRDPLYPNIPYPSRMHQDKQQEKNEVQIYKFCLLSNKEKLLELANTPLNENCSAVILKKLPEKLGDPRKFLIPCGFSELKCKALADLGASINLMPLSEEFEAYLDSDSFPPGSNDTDFDSKGYLRLIEELLNNDPSSPLPLSHNPLSGSTTFSSPNHLLEEFADELALITFPPGNDDLPFDIESDLREIEYLLNQNPTKEMDSILEDSVDEGNLVDPNNDLVDTIPEMFTDEHTLDYSSPPLYDDVDDDLCELESDNDNV
ncbi:hypothetical protein Tco_0894683, partial [Tanacetum coccineum]